MLWFEINGKSVGVFVIILVNIVGGVVEYVKYGYEIVGCVVGVGDVRVSGMDVVYIEIDVISYFGDYGIGFESIIDIVNVVIFYVDKEIR